MEEFERHKMNTNHWTYNRQRALLCLNGEPVAILADLSGKDTVQRELADKIVNALNSGALEALKALVSELSANTYEHYGDMLSGWTSGEICKATTFNNAKAAIQAATLK